MSQIKQYPMGEDQRLTACWSKRGQTKQSLGRSRGGLSTIPSRSNRIVQRWYDTALYKEGNQVERFFNRLKPFGRIATGYEKTEYAFFSLDYLLLHFDLASLIVHTPS